MMVCLEEHDVRDGWWKDRALTGRLVHGEVQDAIRALRKAFLSRLGRRAALGRRHSELRFWAIRNA